MFDAIIHAPASVEIEALPEVRGARSAVTVRNVEVAKPLKAHGAASKFGSSTSTVLYCHCDGGERLVDTALRLDSMTTPGTTMHIKLMNAASLGATPQPVRFMHGPMLPWYGTQYKSFDVT